MKFEFLQTDPTIKVAVDLLGAYLYRITRRGKILSGRIVETEAYLGLQDPACHSFHAKRTSRVEPLYGPAGNSYIYLIYGMYYCVNVVTGDPNTPEAVLIRAVQPLDGVEQMKKHRNKTQLLDLCSGPGKLAQAFDINLELNAHHLNSEPLWIERAPDSPTEKIAVSARIGLPAQKPSSHWPLRFYLAESSYVSSSRPLATKAMESSILNDLLAENLKSRTWQLM